MSFYKEFFLITIEISFAIFLIIFGYAIWDNFDQTEYITAKYYDNIKDFEIYIENNNSYVALKNDENNIEYTKLFLHNISDKDNITKLSFKINKDNYLKNNTTINIDNQYYELKKLDYFEDEYFYYYIIEDIKFKGYETKTYNIKILLDNYDYYHNINYEFVVNI